MAKYLETEERFVEKNSLSIYYKEVGKTPLLKKAGKKYYGKRLIEGDKKAKDEAKDIFVKTNLRYVVSEAKKYQNQGLPLIDLISEGNIGLMTAVEKFNPKKGELTTYSQYWIRQAIRRAIANKSRTIRIPFKRIEDLCHIQKEMNYLEQEGIELDLEFIAKNLNMSVKKVTETLRVGLNTTSLDAPVNGDDENYFVKDRISDRKINLEKDVIYDKGSDVEEEAFYTTLKKDINSIMKILTNQEAEIIRYRCGLNEHPQLSLREVGKIYDFTGERVRQIEKRALKKLRESPKAACLREYFEVE